MAGIIQQPNPLAPGSGALQSPLGQEADAKQSAAARVQALIASISPGESVDGKLARILPEQTALIVALGRSVVLPAPAGAGVGDQVRLSRGADGSLKVEVKAKAAELGLGAAELADLAELEEGSDPLSGNESAFGRLSSAGRSVHEASARAGSLQDKPLLLSGGSPLIESAAESSELGAAVKSKVAASGLFYESHLAKWAAGDATTASLRSEPQAAWQKAAAETPEAFERKGSAPPERTELSRSENAFVQDRFKTELAAAASRDAESTPAAKDMLSRQLETLATGRADFQFSPFPGAAARLQIQEEAGRRPPTDADGAAPWSARITVSAEGFGSVAARISVGPSGVSVRLSPDAQAALKTASGAEDLRSALARAGLSSAQVFVDEQETPR